MKDAKRFLLISLIMHLLVLIVLTHVVLTPADRFDGFLERLYIDMVEVKNIARPEVSRPEAPPKIEPKEEAKEAFKELKPPEIKTFSTSVGDPISNPVRVSNGREVLALRKLLRRPERKGTVSTEPSVLKPVSRATEDEHIFMLPEVHQDSENIAGAGKSTGLADAGLEPMRSKAGTKGSSMDYLYAGASPQQRGKADELADILSGLARGIVKQATGEKVDVVFVIDTTGSMRDNVRGVKDYIHRFLEPIEEKEFDAALGLVEFADQEVKEPKVMGLTRSQRKFKKWLDEIRLFGGDDLAESGYEALIAALEQVDFRNDAQRFFIFMSDAPQHDFDYDGGSRYTLDRVVARLSDEGVKVDVVGANHLSIKQLAWGTGGQWRHIPGGDPLMDIPHPTPSMIRSQLDRSLPAVPVEDRVTIEFSSSMPDWVDFSYKMLDPRGFKCLGTLTYRIKVRQEAGKKVEFFPKMDLSRFKDNPGIYTLIYRIRDSIGNRDILRRTLELRGEDS